ncbi:hypothetical protein [Chengkuizengella marina]|uniref:Peptidase MA superfamily protein n=1 Tax=Chengkuizengella marina TaxID=2507566 RepID=A0A6N9PWK1_9BACL|nr:hypothetical protein [Chengkuizengella marina]NBI27899.1 hypothetical protein [Chengkuizengella marina]
MIRIVLFFGLLLLTACSSEETLLEETPPKENVLDQTEEENNKIRSNKNSVVTEDGKITFTIFNYVNVSQEKVESIKKELLDAYNVIHQSIETNYVPSETINVFLSEGYEQSWGIRTSVNLYNIKNEKYPLVHELTHTLLGYGEHFGSEKGYFTQEGYAVYMGNKYGKVNKPLHWIMKRYIDVKHNIPLQNLIDLNIDDEYFRPEQDSTLQRKSYIHAGSFITYLIDTYGIHKFEKIYNTDHLDMKFQEVYGKTINELEKEWIDYIKEITS